jgi:aryl-alcohol dehydrogenase-like predicted oxidoreductase
MMELRTFGQTGLKVSALGFGAGQIGDGRLAEEQVSQILNMVLDAGVTLIDTARGYGLSEERIGRHIAHRRHEFVLSTKVGYSIDGFADWSYDIILVGIETALRLMQTEVLDIVHLHSCSLEILQRGEVIHALNEAKRQGKIKVAAYSGDNESLVYAVQSGQFGSLMTSVNICDQRNLTTTLPTATQQGMGIIAKRPIANAPWRFQTRPVGDYAEEYWVRWQKMGLQFELPWPEIALRFTAFHTGAHSCIVGTTHLPHLQENLRVIQHGPLPLEIVETLRHAFQQHDEGWVGQV